MNKLFGALAILIPGLIFAEPGNDVSREEDKYIHNLRSVASQKFSKQEEDIYFKVKKIKDARYNLQVELDERALGDKEPYEIRR